MNNIFNSYILWLGGIFDEDAMASNHAVSPAANLWQEGFIKALKSEGLHVINLTHLPEPLWPKGRFCMRSANEILAKDISGEVVSYYNLPFWRHQSLKKAYVGAFNSIIQNEGPPRLLISYNLAYQNIALGIYAQKRLKIPWVCIVADQLNEKLKWRYVYKISKPARGRIFLSWFGYENCPYRPKFHLDGGVDKLHLSSALNARAKKNNKLVVFYAGSMGRWGGVSFLIKGFKLVKNQNVELWICGKGMNKDVEREVVLDRRVKFLGFVSKKRLEELYEAADIFVNPRPSELPENRYNFPSKLLDYFSYCKPVISTWTEGLSPDYRDILILLERETPECLAQKIEEVLEWNENRRKDLSLRIKRFLETDKIWPIQADRLLKWLKHENLLFM